MPSCCVTPAPSLFRLGEDQGGWAVYSTCEACGATRRETGYRSVRLVAEADMARVREAYTTPWRGGRAAPPA